MNFIGMVGTKLLVYNLKFTLSTGLAILLFTAGFSWPGFCQSGKIPQQSSSLLDSAKININLNPGLCISFANEYLKTGSPNDTLKAEAFNLKAESFLFLSMYDSALAIYLNLENSFAGFQNQKKYFEILNKTGRVYARAGDFANAEFRFTKSLDYALLNNDSAMMAKTFNNLGNIKTQTGNPEKALDFFLKSYQIKVKIKDTQTIGNTLINLGNVYGSLGKNQMAMDYFKKALNYIHPDTDPYNFTSIQINMGANLLEMNQLTEAKKLFELSLEMSRQNGFQNLIPGIYQNFAELSRLKGDFENALIYTNLFNKASDSLGNQVAVQKIRTLESRLESEKKDKEISQLLAEKAGKELELARNRNKIVFVLLSTIIVLLASSILSKNVAQAKPEPDSEFGQYFVQKHGNKYGQWLAIVLLSAYYVMFFHLFSSVAINLQLTQALIVFLVLIVIIVFLGSTSKAAFSKISNHKVLKWRTFLSYGIVTSVVIVLTTVVWAVFRIVFRLEIFFGNVLFDMAIASVVPVSGLAAFIININIHKNRILIRELNSQLKNLKSSLQSEINPDTTIKITGRNSNEVLEIRKNCFVFAKAEDNYMKIYYLEQSVLTMVLFRGTLSELEEQLKPFSGIQRCHRSYLINALHILEIKGNKKKSFAIVNIEGVPEIPFSINFLKNQDLL